MSSSGCAGTIGRMSQKSQKTVEPRGGETSHRGASSRSSSITHSDDEWMRLPKPAGRLWGLSRTSWIELLESGKVRSIKLRKRHSQRGITLIFRPSAEAYLHGLLDGPNGHDGSAGIKRSMKPKK